MMVQDECGADETNIRYDVFTSMHIAHEFCDTFVTQANQSLYQPGTNKPINPHHYLYIRCKVHRFIFHRPCVLPALRSSGGNSY